jgi:nucleoside-diphosphate-sugar epimerase
MSSKKNIFLTGATGTMGRAFLDLMISHLDTCSITALIPRSPADEARIRPYQKQGIQVVWGDIVDPGSVRQAMGEADLVIHLAAIIPPLADHQPELARKVNETGTANVIAAIKQSGRQHEIKLVYIGTVAETGERLPPLHWGRVGDPIKPSIYDYYGVTKVNAERMVIDSGLPHWVSLRQTSIAHFGLLNVRDGIIFHQPLHNCFEWITAHDAGRMIANLCLSEPHASFWNDIYNVGGGPTCRITFWELLHKVYALIGVKDLKEITDFSWFSTRNFHGHWFTDSDILQQHLKFRRESIDDFVMQLDKTLPVHYRFASLLPKAVFKNFAMRPLASSSNGPLYWNRNRMESHVKAFFGTKDHFQKSRAWRDFTFTPPSPHPVFLDHGYDEKRPLAALSLAEIQEAARFRGGHCLSNSIPESNIAAPLQWECASGHRFTASIRLVLKAGHFCPHCLPLPWNYGLIARSNPFLAQAWYPFHTRDEEDVYA